MNPTEQRAAVLAEVRSLAEAVCTGTVTPEQCARLNALLPADEEAALCYATYLRMHGLMLWRWRDQIVIHAGEAQPAAAAPLPSGLLGQTWQGGVGFFSQLIPFSYLTATVITAAALFGMWLWRLPDYRQQLARRPEPAAAPAQEPEKESVGRITGMVDCRWAEPRTAPPSSTAVPLGDKYVLDSGLMEIAYDSGATVILQGPCSYEVESPTSGVLSFGKLTARVEKLSAISDQLSEISKSPNLQISKFVVRTPTAVVTDLGTEFGVEVDQQGETQSHVFVGEVRVVALGAPRGADGATTLQAGQTARCNRREGVVVSAAPTGGERFVRSLRPGTAQVVERFNDAALGPGFEQMPPGGYVNERGAAVYQEPAQDPGRNRRAYIRSTASDFCDRDFVFEATFQVDLPNPEKAGGYHWIYFGLGDGVPNPSYADEVRCGLVLAYCADDGRVEVQLCRPDSVYGSWAGTTTVAAVAPQGSLAPGRHRFRLSKTGGSLRFAVDAACRGPFHADFTSWPIDLRSTAPLLNAANSRLLVGTGNCKTMTVRFEELSAMYTMPGIVAPPQGLADVAARKPIVKCSGVYGYGEFPASLDPGIWEKNGPQHVTDGITDETKPSNGYWLGREQTPNEYFILDLADRFDVERIELMNTHNSIGNDRGTKDFEIWAADEIDRDSELIAPRLVLKGTLPCRFGAGPKIPFDVFSAASGDFPRFQSRFLKFVAKTYYHRESGGAGLNEIRVFAVPAGSRNTQPGVSSPRTIGVKPMNGP